MEPGLGSDAQEGPIDCSRIRPTRWTRVRLSRGLLQPPYAPDLSYCCLSLKCQSIGSTDKAINQGRAKDRVRKSMHINGAVTVMTYPKVESV